MEYKYKQVVVKLNDEQEMSAGDLEKLARFFNDRWNPFVEVPLPPKPDGTLSIYFLLRKMDFAS